MPGPTSFLNSSSFVTSFLSQSVAMSLQSHVALCPIMDGGNTLLMSAVRATVNVAAGFGSMANDLAAAMLAFGRQIVDRAFKAIVVMGDAIHHDFQGLVIFI